MFFKSKKKNNDTVRCLTMNANTGKVEVVRISTSSYEMIKMRAEMLDSLTYSRMLTELEQFELNNYKLMLMGCELAQKFDIGVGKNNYFKTIYDMYAALAAQKASDNEATGNN